MTNEYAAMKGLADSKERAKQDYIADRNTVTRFEESERKESVNMQFWHRVWVSCNVLLLLIVIYAAFSFGASL